MTDKQLEANRNNAQLSTGPRTEEGKNRSRLNAKRHGLTGQVSTMTEEDRAAHDKFAQALIDDLAPSGAMETQLAQRIATDSWRLNRLSAIEDNIYAMGFWNHSGEMNAGHPQIDAALAMAVTFTEQSAELQRLSLYEQRLNRAVQKNLAELKKLQAERKLKEKADLRDAQSLLRLAEQKGNEYHPSSDGFVFFNRPNPRFHPARTTSPERSCEKRGALPPSRPLQTRPEPHKSRLMPGSGRSISSSLESDSLDGISPYPSG